MFSLDKYGRVPIYEQLIEQVEGRILDGTLGEQDALPSVRALAVSLGINPNTLQKAYMELERRGICASVPGSGRFVVPGARGRVAGARRGRLSELAQIAGQLAGASVPLDEALHCVEDAYKRAGAAYGQADRGGKSV